MPSDEAERLRLDPRHPATRLDQGPAPQPPDRANCVLWRSFDRIRKPPRWARWLAKSEESLLLSPRPSECRDRRRAMRQFALPGEALEGAIRGLRVPVVLEKSRRVAERAAACVLPRIAKIEPEERLDLPPLSVVEHEPEGLLKHALLAVTALVQWPAPLRTSRAPSELGQPKAGPPVMVPPHYPPRSPDFDAEVMDAPCVRVEGGGTETPLDALHAVEVVQKGPGRWLGGPGHAGQDDFRVTSGPGESLVGGLHDGRVCLGRVPRREELGEVRLVPDLPSLDWLRLLARMKPLVSIPPIGSMRPIAPRRICHERPPRPDLSRASDGRIVGLACDPRRRRAEHWKGPQATGRSNTHQLVGPTPVVNTLPRLDHRPPDAEAEAAGAGGVHLSEVVAVQLLCPRRNSEERLRRRRSARAAEGERDRATN